MTHETLDLRVVVVFLLAAGLVVPFMQRLRVSPVIGFIVVGMIIGPFGLGLLVETFPFLRYVVIEDAKGVAAIAELGIVFLLFMIGLELSISRLMSMRRMVFGLGGAQVILTSIAIGLVAWWWGNEPAAAIILGACLALSSTAVVMQLLIENKRLATPVGQTSFAVLLFQDLAVVPILFLVGVLGQPGEGSIALAFALAVGKAIAAVGLILLLGRVVIRPLFRMVGATKSPELFMAALLLMIIGAAELTLGFGLSMALGAFMAGLLMAETEFKHQIEVDVEPFKGLLLGLFFVSIGMNLDIRLVLEQPILLFASVIGLGALKAGILYVLARLFGVPRSVAFESAALLGQGGEFAFVVIGLALTAGLLLADVGNFMLLVATISMILTPFVAWAVRHLGKRLSISERDASLEPDAVQGAAAKNHVVLAGFGRVGQIMGSLLDTQKIPYVALDLDTPTVAHFREQGAAVYYGDASREEILKRVGIETTIALVVTMDSAAAAERVVRGVRANHPGLPIIARARDTEHAKRLLAAGATNVVPETLEASLDLGEVVLGAIGIGAETAHQIIAERRDIERAGLRSFKATKPIEA